MSSLSGKKNGYHGDPDNGFAPSASGDLIKDEAFQRQQTVSVWHTCFCKRCGVGVRFWKGLTEGHHAMPLNNPDIISLIIYFAALFGTIGNSVLIFAFLSNAIRNKVFQPLDRVIMNMAVVNLLLCCYKEIPGLLVFFDVKVFGPSGCSFLLYFYHTLRLISIWSVENLSFLHLIKIRRPRYSWSKFIHRNQGQYVNWSLASCWAISIISHIPYLLYKDLGARNKSNLMMTSTNCIGPSQSQLMRAITYSTVGVDFLLIVLVIILNGLTIDLICRHRRHVKDKMTTRRAWNKHTAKATKILLSLLLLYVICWISSDVVWIAIVSGLMENDYDGNMLSGYYGILSSIYYSVSSCIMIFGYRQVKDYLTERGSCCGLGSRTSTPMERMI